MWAEQCVELDFQYASEGIHRRWDSGFRITACASTPDQAAFVLSVPRRRPLDETQVHARMVRCAIAIASLSCTLFCSTSLGVGVSDCMLGGPSSCSA